MEETVASGALLVGDHVDGIKDWLERIYDIKPAVWDTGAVVEMEQYRFLIFTPGWEMDPLASAYKRLAEKHRRHIHYYLVDNETGPFLWHEPVHETWQQRKAREVCEAKEAEEVKEPAECRDWVADALDQIRIINQTKRADYASNADIFSNFRQVADATGLTMDQVVDVFIETKKARIQNLQEVGKAPQNEALIDSYLDLAVYAVIRYAMQLEKAAMEDGFDD